MTSKNPTAIWLTGIPASGKTTLAGRVVSRLREAKAPVLWLDSDDLRAVLTPEPTYSHHERTNFYAAIRHIATLAISGGVNVVISATAPLRAHRDPLRDAIPHFLGDLARLRFYNRCTARPQGPLSSRLGGDCAQPARRRRTLRTSAAGRPHPSKR